MKSGRMTVYRPKSSPNWAYDFVIKGQRFYGSTGQTSKQRATGVEAALREQAALRLARETNDGPPLPKLRVPTLNYAAGEWWEAKGRDLGSPANEHTRLAILQNAVLLIGKDKLVTEIRTADIASAMQKRRARLVHGHPPANSTVNVQIIAVIRPIIRRGCKLAEVGVPPIDWGEVRLPEPKPKARDFSDDQLSAVIGKLPAHWHAFARFQSRYGCRVSEMFFGLADLDIEGARLKLRDRKGGDDHIIPLMPEDVAMLAARKGQAQAAGIDTVWFRIVRRGKVKALALETVKSALSRAMRQSGLHDAMGAKGSHDLRRHAGMRILRTTGNLRVTQRLLGHANINSTLVYAHAMEGDLRDALNAVSRSSPGEAKPAPETPNESKAVGDT